MEEEQIKQQLEWLEDKRKKDSKNLETLHGDVRALEGQIKSIEKKISGIPTELTRLSENISRINQLDDALVRQREDISRQLNEFNEKRDKREKQKQNLEKKDRDNLVKDFNRVQEEFAEIKKGLDFVKAKELEGKRISAALDDLKNEMGAVKETVEATNHAAAVMEEGRKHDLRRIGDLSADVDSVREKQDKYLVSQETIETRARRLEEQLNKYTALEGERREELDMWMQQQQSRLLDYERSWKEWMKKFEAFDKKADQIEEQIKSYQETYLSMKQVGQEMTDLMDKLERRITEIAEMQRLSEDKLRKDLNVFLADDQKRWNTFKLTYEERWREHDRTHEKMGELLEELEKMVYSAEHSTNQMNRFSKKQILDLLAIIRDWATDIEESGPSS